MATQIKAVARDGKFGLILHQHGESGWHPANEVHADRMNSRVKANDHTVHEAGHKDVIKALKAFAKPEEAFTFKDAEDKDVSYALDAAWLESEYKACLEGKTQTFWNIQWKLKLSNRKTRKAAKEAGEDGEGEEAPATEAKTEDKVLATA